IEPLCTLSNHQSSTSTCPSRAAATIALPLSLDAIAVMPSSPSSSSNQSKISSRPARLASTAASANETRSLNRRNPLVCHHSRHSTRPLPHMAFAS
ncbi:hypothetical protein BCR44DRAFT_1443538, partial [Catenaria anguillulae PL171]